MDDCHPHRDHIHIMVASPSRAAPKERHPFLVWCSYAVEHTWSILPYVAGLLTVPPIAWKVLCTLCGWD